VSQTVGMQTCERDTQAAKLTRVFALIRVRAVQKWTCP
jgi:hypothetical protein